MEFSNPPQISLKNNEAEELVELNDVTEDDICEENSYEYVTAPTVPTVPSVPTVPTVPTVQHRNRTITTSTADKEF